MIGSRKKAPHHADAESTSGFGALKWVAAVGIGMVLLIRFFLKS